MNNSRQHVTVIIPALNEEASIGLVLDGLPRDRVDDMIVADNNSDDRTAEVAQSHGAFVVHETQRGYGAACLAGLRAMKEDTDVIVFIDADYSDDPTEIYALLEQIEAGYDLVIGSRLLGSAEPGALLPQARFGNMLACALMRLFFGYRFTDLGPFRAITRQALDTLKMEDQAFGWTVEMQIKALLYEMKVTEVPVSYKKRIGVSKITGTLRGTFLAGTTILTAIFGAWLGFKFQKKCRDN